MKKLFLAIAAASLISGAAFAQPASAARHDVREIRADQREIARDRAELRQDQRELRQDQRELRADVRNASWHRPVQARPVQTRLVVGAYLAPAAYAPRTAIRHPGRIRLQPANAHQRWVRVHDDAVLVNIYTGRVARIAYNIFR